MLDIKLSPRKKILPCQLHSPDLKVTTKVKGKGRVGHSTCRFTAVRDPTR